MKESLKCLCDKYDIKVFTDNIEDSAIEQLELLLSIPVFQQCKLAIMPDVHAGAGCVIGFTGNLGDKVIPNIVGVDIGCGMLVVKLSACPNFEKLQKVIEEYIPYGMRVHEFDFFGKIKEEYIQIRYKEYKRLIQELYCYRYLHDAKHQSLSMGTLGGGNHFIEVDKNKDGEYFLVIHSGSRNLGKQVADYYQKLAIKMHQGWDAVMEEQKKLIERYKAEGRRSEIQDAIKELHKNYKAKNPDVPRQLCWLEGEEYDNYLHDMQICQILAEMNRATIADLILRQFPGITEEEQFTTVHNYIGVDHIIRKGAIACRKNERVIIPMNMRDGSLICIGKGNPDWNYSGPHGAGRIMSRAKAFDTINIEDYQKSMEGITSWSVNENTIDEAPMVYKPMEEIIRNIQPTCEVLDIIKPVFNFKASEDRK